MTTEGASVVAREEVRDWEGRAELTEDGEMEARGGEGEMEMEAGSLEVLNTLVDV